MNELEKLRVEIDDIDTKICKLFEKRMEVAKAIGQYKKENGLEVLDSKREDIVLEKASKRIKNKNLEKYYLELVKELMELSKKYQKE